ncbi:MAG: hypothetical protein L0Y72_28000 [Gemmataceae bacterium]|nr:hypothetical protein [Gemmataceae bacterium]MCI0742891.1 hypothetical protein [Gemmataceae bacterium]
MATYTLEEISIATPCGASWNEMSGDDRVRFCSQCRLSVYNLADMSRREAEEFIAANEGRACIRMYRRPDGTVLTRDCPVGLRHWRRRLVFACSAAFLLLCALCFWGYSLMLNASVGQPGHGLHANPLQRFWDFLFRPKGMRQEPMDFVMGKMCVPVNKLAEP